MPEAPSIKEALIPCPFCGGKGRLYQSQNAAALWRVCCENCDAGPHSHIGHEEAIKRWNTRATFQPDGERREAIAQALLDRFIERGFARIQGSMFPRGTKINEIVHSYRDDFYADADAVILASGLVQDEAAIRKNEREECAKIAENPPKAEGRGHACIATGRSIAAAIRSARDGGEA